MYHNFVGSRRYVLLSSADALPGFTFHKEKAFGSNCLSEKDIWTGNRGSKEKCAKMCSDSLVCTAFLYKKDGWCRLSNFCTLEQAVTGSDFSLYVKGKLN